MSLRKDILNINIDLVKRAKDTDAKYISQEKCCPSFGTESHPHMFDLVILAVCIQSRYVSGCMLDISALKFMREFHVGKAVATRLCKLCKESDLFVYEADKNCLRVRSTHGTRKIHRVTIKGERAERQYQSANVHKIEKEVLRNMTFREIKRLLNDLLIANVIKIKENDFLNSSKKHSKSDKWNIKRNALAISLGMFATFSCLAASTVSRHMKRMCDVVEKTPSTITTYHLEDYMGGTDNCGSTLNQRIIVDEKRGLVYLVEGCKYMLHQPNFIVHKIYHYNKEREGKVYSRSAIYTD